MVKLRELVFRYINNDIDYSAFRREFVSTFLAVWTDDAILNGAVVDIESLCADVAEGELRSEELLKEQLRQLVTVVSSPELAVTTTLLGTEGTLLLSSPGTNDVLNLQYTVLPSGACQAFPWSASGNIAPSVSLGEARSNAAVLNVRVTS